MAMKEKTSWKARTAGSFRKGLLIYVLFFAAALAVGHRVLWTFLEEYEASRPANSIDEYIESFDAEHIRQISADFTASLNTAICPEAEAFSIISDLFTQSLEYKYTGPGEQEDLSVYALFAGEQKLGKVIIRTVPGTGKFDFDTTQVDSESFDFSFLLKQPRTIRIPADWSVSVGGFRLDDTYLTDYSEGLQLFEDFADYTDIHWPEFVEYKVENYINDIVFSVSDASGNAVETEGYDGTNEMDFLPACSAEEVEQLQEFGEAFCTRYITFLSNANESPVENCAELLKYVVEDSNLATRLSNAKSGLQYAQSDGDELQKFEITLAVPVEDGVAYLESSYTTRTLGNEGYVVTNTPVRFLAKETDQGWKAYVMLAEPSTVIQDTTKTE